VGEVLFVVVVVEAAASLVPSGVVAGADSLAVALRALAAGALAPLAAGFDWTAEGLDPPERRPPPVNDENNSESIFHMGGRQPVETREPWKA
jgi:hypothetical protein